jgi:hypothetical protein
MNQRRNTLVQSVIVFLVIAAAVVAAVNQTMPPKALPASAAASEFSAGRAIEHIKIIAQTPRIVGQPGFELARDYVMDGLRALGLGPEIQKTSITLPDPLLQYLGWNVEPTQNVENIFARMVGSQSPDAILLVAHLDSKIGPGASDDANGSAVLMETARALRAGPPLRNTVIFLFTAPEETGAQGAVAFILQHPWIKNVKLVINIDAGGFNGPSELTNTSPNYGWLIRELSKADPYAFGTTSSNGGSASDFNAFKFYGFSGYAFDYARDRRIHTSFDSIENLNPASIQHQGYHALYLTRYFGNLASLQDPKDPDPIYFNILRLGLVYYPKTWVIPIMLMCLLVFTSVMVTGFRRKQLTLVGLSLGALIFAVSAITAPAIVRLLWAVLSNSVPRYELTYYGHAVNEPLLLALFASVVIAVTSFWYALHQKIWKLSLPDLTMGALSLLTIAMIFYSINSPDSSYGISWSLLCSLLPISYWFFSMKNKDHHFTLLQIVLFLLSAIVAIALLVPDIYMSFTGSDTNDLFMPMLVLVVVYGLGIPVMQIITKPNKWWLPVAAGLAAIVLAGFTIYG